MLLQKNKQKIANIVKNKMTEPIEMCIMLNIGLKPVESSPAAQ